MIGKVRGWLKNILIESIQDAIILLDNSKMYLLVLPPQAATEKELESLQVALKGKANVVIVTSEWFRLIEVNCSK